MRISLNRQSNNTGLKGAVVALETTLAASQLKTKLDGISVASLEGINDAAQIAVVDDVTSDLDKKIMADLGVEEFSEGDVRVPTAAQRKAAVITAMAFADPREYVK